jgi:hypothetical protein
MLGVREGGGKIDIHPAAIVSPGIPRTSAELRIGRSSAGVSGNAGG